MTDVVKPCPFCGVMPVVRNDCLVGSRYMAIVACRNDHCRVEPDVTGETRTEAVERWNRREG